MIMKKILVAASVAVLALGVMPVLASPVVSIDAGVISQDSHFTECLGLMFTDPAEHAKECGPSRTGPVFVSSGGFGCVRQSSDPKAPCYVKP